MLQFQPLLPPLAVQSLGATLLNLLLPQARPSQLLDVVHHAVQVPLCADLDAPAVVQAVKTFVVPNVAKHRLHRANALAVELPASG